MEDSIVGREPGPKERFFAVAADEKGIEEGFEVTRVTLLPFFRASLSDPFKEQEQQSFSHKV